MTEVELINRWLSDQGKNLRGEPIYRLVWSDDLYEFRHGTFRDFYGNLFLREVTETRRTRKYGYIQERFIFEKWAPPEIAFSRELPESINGDYIPVFVFEDKNGKYLKPTLKVVEFLVRVCKDEVRIDRTPVPTSEEIDRRAYEHFYDAIDSSEIQNALHLRQAIVRP